MLMAIASVMTDLYMNPPLVAAPMRFADYDSPVDARGPGRPDRPLQGQLKPKPPQIEAEHTRPVGKLPLTFALLDSGSSVWAELKRP